MAILIGIDPGTHTGLAVWDSRKSRFLEIETLMIHEALFKVLDLHEQHNGEISLFIEDARHTSRDGADSRARIQGAGSIKRDCSIWEDFCEDYCIPYQLIRPGKGMTKVTPEYFKLVTKWKSRTSNHARDAAMLVFGR